MRRRASFNAGEFDAKMTLGVASFVPAVQIVRNLTRGALGAGKNEMRLAELSQGLTKKFTKKVLWLHPLATHCIYKQLDDS